MLELSLFTHKKIFRRYLLEVVKLCETDLMKIELLPVRPHAKYHFKQLIPITIYLISFL